MKMQNLIDAQAALSILSMCGLSVQAKYALDKNMTKINPIIQEFNTKRFEAISAIEGVELSEDKQTFKIEGHEQEVQAAIAALTDAEVDIELHGIDIESLARITITPVDLSKIISRNLIDDLSAIGMIKLA